MADAQTYANHARWHPVFHFFALPVMAINFVWSIVELVQTPSWNSGRWVVVSLALLFLASLVRTYPLKAQDRTIRLEENLRYQRVLSPALVHQAGALTIGQVIALRFAPDDELEELVSAVLAGKLTKRAEIKQAIKNWRSDTFRV